MTELREPIIIERMRPFSDETRITFANNLAALLQETEIIKSELKEHNKEIKRTIASNEESIASISETLTTGLMMKELKVYIKDDDEGRPCYHDYQTDEFLEFVGVQPSDTEVTSPGGTFEDVFPTFSEEKEDALNETIDEKDSTVKIESDGIDLLEGQKVEEELTENDGELF